MPTLEGKANLTVPAETQTGKQFRLRGKGVRALRGGHVGDLFCHVVVETPIRLDSEQKELLQKLTESMKADGKNHTPRAKTWFDSVKAFFGGE